MTVPAPRADSSPVYVCYALYTDRPPAVKLRLRAAMETGLIDATFTVSSHELFAIFAAENFDDLQVRLDTLGKLLQYGSPNLIMASATSRVLDQIRTSTGDVFRAMVVAEAGDEPESEFEFTSRLADIPNATIDPVQISVSSRSLQASDGYLVLITADSPTALQRDLTRVVQAVRYVQRIYDPTIQEFEDGTDQGASGRRDGRAPMIFDAPMEARLERIATRRGIPRNEAIKAAIVALDWIDQQLASGARFLRSKRGIRRRVRFPQ